MSKQERQMKPTGQMIEAMATPQKLPTNITDPVLKPLIESHQGITGYSRAKDADFSQGMLNHSLLCARMARFAGKKVNEALRTRGDNYRLDINRMYQAHWISHLARIYWDKNNDKVEFFKQKSHSTNEETGIKYLKALEMPQDLVTIVGQLGHGTELSKQFPDIKGSLEARIAMYIDHKVEQVYIPQMRDRWINLFLSAEIIKKEFKQDNQIKQETLELMQHVIDEAKSNPGMTATLAAEMFLSRGYFNTIGSRPGSSLEGWLNLMIIDAHTEAYLESLGLQPSTWMNEEQREFIPKEEQDAYTFIPATRDERYIRRLHILSAYDEISKIHAIPNRNQVIFRDVKGKFRKANRQRFYEREVSDVVKTYGKNGYSEKQRPITEKYGEDNAQRGVVFFRYLDSIREKTNS